MRESRLQKAYRLLREYTGDNNMLLYYKKFDESGRLILTEDDFQTDYILKNYNFECFDVNKVVKISLILGESLREKYDLDFTPEKIKIVRVIGEMGNSIHCYAQYRKSVRPQLMYIQRKYLLGPLQDVNYENLDIDFDKYDKLTEKYGRKLKEHQKTAVKFLVANRKCILADSMGLGKTTSAIVAALECGCKKILVITTASLKSTWKREIGFYEPALSI